MKKAWFIDYVGRKQQPEDGVVTVGMVVETFAQEFPEFLMVVAEENWIRGYRRVSQILKKSSEKLDSRHCRARVLRLGGSHEH